MSNPLEDIPEDVQKVLNTPPENPPAPAAGPTTPEPLEKLRGELAGAIHGSLLTLQKGIGEDLQRFAEQIALDAAEAMAAGDDKILGELKNQIRLIGERHRIRLSREAWTIFERVTGAILDIAWVAIQFVPEEK